MYLQFFLYRSIKVYQLNPEYLYGYDDDGNKTDTKCEPFRDHVNLRGILKSNTSYFIVLAHSVRGGSWWYLSRYLPKFHYILLPRERWQQRGSRSIPPCGKMMPTDINQYLLNVYGAQTLDVSTVSAVTTATVFCS